MRQYLDLIQQVLTEGRWATNRTGIRTLKLPGAMMRFDLTKGFPAITTKRVAFKSAIAELLGFLRGYQSARDFRELGTPVWNQNANENKAWLDNAFRQGEDDLGPIYGAQWRSWPAYKLIPLGRSSQMKQVLAQGYQYLGDVQQGAELFGVFFKAIDQIRACFDKIINTPDDRRILFHGWNLAQLDEMALPPCHLLYQFLPDVDARELSMTVYVRSNDLGLGCPFNMVESAALQHLMAHLTGYQPKWLVYLIGDAHIYENHIDMLTQQLGRKPYPLPRLNIAQRIPCFSQTGVPAPEWFALAEPADFSLEGYRHHPPLTAPMAV